MVISKEKNGAFCQFCVLFAKNVRHKSTAVKLVSGPLVNFRRLSGEKGDLSSHQKLVYHKDAQTAKADFVRKGISLRGVLLISYQAKRQEGEANRAFKIIDWFNFGRLAAAYCLASYSYD